MTGVDAPICPTCEIEMQKRLATYAIGGVIIRDTPYYFCKNVDECANAEPEDMETLRKHYRYCWDAGRTEIDYDSLQEVSACRFG